MIRVILPYHLRTLAQVALPGATRPPRPETDESVTAAPTTGS